MKIIKQSEIDIAQIVGELKEGKTIVYPTETCYGLGCDATNAEAVEKIFAIKKRQSDKAVLVLVPDVEMVMQYVDWNEQLEELSQKYWPGPLTVVTKVKENTALPKGVLSSDNTLAFRVTEHPFAKELAEFLGKPLFSTSANISSHASPYDIESVLKMFENTDNQPDVIIDAGTLPHRSPSTIVRVENGELSVLRQGEIVV